MPAKELLTAWLNDAHAMEQALIPILENHAKDARDHPEMRARLEQHVEETRRHEEMVKSCIERLGEQPSTSKSVVGKVLGNMTSVGTGMFRDELVKNCLSDFAAENLEIASYQALVAAAREAGDEATARTCEEILRDEETMAGWLEDNLPMVVGETLRTYAVA